MPWMMGGDAWICYDIGETGSELETITRLRLPLTLTRYISDTVIVGKESDKNGKERTNN